jgi:alkylated DNA repair dioxygenase AlkB
VAVLQGSLFATGAGAGPRPLGLEVERTALADGAWVDLRRSWVEGADDLFVRLMDSVPWQAQRRSMYDRMVDVPRLQSFYDERSDAADPVLTECSRALGRHYLPELGEPFSTLGLCLYRNGDDSVAWHGDTIGRGAVEDTVVAIVSLGATRTILLRPAAGGRSIRFELASGDLLVMGGSCQRTWQHAVPKTRRPVGPRISAQFRPRGMR